MTIDYEAADAKYKTLAELWPSMPEGQLFQTHHGKVSHDNAWSTWRREGDRCMLIIYTTGDWVGDCDLSADDRDAQGWPCAHIEPHERLTRLIDEDYLDRLRALRALNEQLYMAEIMEEL